LISQPFGNHEKLAGARSVTAVVKETTNGGGENKATGASDHSHKGPESDTSTAVDKEVPRKERYGSRCQYSNSSR
jgi:hypothetical protein